MEESQTSLAADLPLVEKRNDLLSLVQYDVAEELDQLAAQSLLAGGRDAGNQTAFVSRPHPTSEVVHLVLSLSAPVAHLVETTSNIHPLFGRDTSDTGPGPCAAVECTVEVSLADTARQTFISASAPLALTLGDGIDPSLEEFPPLMKRRTLKIRDSFEAGMVKHNFGMGLASGGAGTIGTGAAGLSRRDTPPMARSPKWILAGSATDEPGPGNTAMPTINMDVSIEGGAGVSGVRAGSTRQGSAALAGGVGSVWGNTNGPRNLAETLRERPDPNGPQVFVSEKINNIGFASTSNGLPSIYFSGAETKNLRTTLGHAIVGKFSHSIPTAG